MKEYQVALIGLAGAGAWWSMCVFFKQDPVETMILCTASIAAIGIVVYISYWLCVALGHVILLMI